MNSQWKQNDCNWPELNHFHHINVRRLQIESSESIVDVLGLIVLYVLGPFHTLVVSEPVRSDFQPIEQKAEGRFEKVQWGLRDKLHSPEKRFEPVKSRKSTRNLSLPSTAIPFQIDSEHCLMKQRKSVKQQREQRRIPSKQ